MSQSSQSSPAERLRQIREAHEANAQALQRELDNAVRDVPPLPGGWVPEVRDWKWVVTKPGIGAIGCTDSQLFASFHGSLPVSVVVWLLRANGIIE